jgi:hypothetical protein
MFYLDVAKVDLDVIHVAMATHMLQVYVPNVLFVFLTYVASVFVWMSHIFHTYVASVLSGCCIFEWLFMSFQVFSKCFRCIF